MDGVSYWGREWLAYDRKLKPWKTMNTWHVRQRVPLAEAWETPAFKGTEEAKPATEVGRTCVALRGNLENGVTQTKERRRISRRWGEVSSVKYCWEFNEDENCKEYLDLVTMSSPVSLELLGINTWQCVKVTTEGRGEETREHHSFKIFASAQV